MQGLQKRTSNLWDDELEAARPAIRVEAADFIRRFPSPEADMSSPMEWARVQREAERALVVISEKGRDRQVSGRNGSVQFREFRPERPAGVLLHIHGGGWVTGEPALTDLLNEALSERLNVAVVSVDYRLAPEHPYPAGPDDCESAALWLLDNAVSEYGCQKLLIGGESAGAHLSVVTLLRLRDRHDAADRFSGASLVFGAYDLSPSPSATGIGRNPATSDILKSSEMAYLLDQFLPKMGVAERRHPDVSPLYADLAGMPPALFTVGSADHLVDDTLFLADRWQVAGGLAELIVYPDAPHGCIALPTVMSHWWPRLEAFLSQCLVTTDNTGRPTENP